MYYRNLVTIIYIFIEKVHLDDLELYVVSFVAFAMSV